MSRRIPLGHVIESIPYFFHRHFVLCPGASQYVGFGEIIERKNASFSVCCLNHWRRVSLATDRSDLGKRSTRHPRSQCFLRNMEKQSYFADGIPGDFARIEG